MWGTRGFYWYRDLANMTVLGYVLIAVAFLISLPNVPAIRQMVDECRKDSPSSDFSAWNYLPAWWYHVRHFPNSDLRRRLHIRVVLGLALVAAGTVLVEMGRGH
jgi:hypothetical protein